MAKAGYSLFKVIAFSISVSFVSQLIENTSLIFSKNYLVERKFDSKFLNEFKPLVQ